MRFFTVFFFGVVVGLLAALLWLVNKAGAAP